MQVSQPGPPYSFARFPAMYCNLFTLKKGQSTSAPLSVSHVTEGYPLVSCQCKQVDGAYDRRWQQTEIQAADEFPNGSSLFACFKKMATVKHRILCHVKGALANLRRDRASTRRTPPRQPPAARGSLKNTHSTPAEETFAPPPSPVRRSTTEIAGSCTVSSFEVNGHFGLRFAFIVIQLTTMYVPACNFSFLSVLQII